jgi:hypothetical protein
LVESDSSSGSFHFLFCRFHGCTTFSPPTFLHLID